MTSSSAGSHLQLPAGRDHSGRSEHSNQRRPDHSDWYQYNRKSPVSAAKQPEESPLVFAAIFWIPGGIAAAIKPRKGKGSSKHHLLLLLALLIGLGGMTACSGGSASSSNSSTPKGVSTVQVMAAGAGSLTQTVSLTLNVQ